MLIFGKWDRESVCESGLEALGNAGEAALAPLATIVTNHIVSARYRALAAENIGYIGYLGMRTDLGTNARCVVVPLTSCLQETNGDVSFRAADALGDLRLEPGIAVPALTRALKAEDSLTRHTAAKALGEFGSQAVAAVPELLTMAASTDEGNRIAATNALRRIAPEVLKKSGD
jgi:HEAT repeat protein